MARQVDTDERDSVHGVNPGTELGRYTLDTQVETITGGQRWTARDAQLECDVTLLVMPADEPTTAAALDAARRAAGVEAAQLTRILDVGTEGDLSYIAEESLAESTALTAAIGRKGLPAEEVRRISGEVATGLEAARARGLHHLALTPETVLLTPDGRVKVRGLATTAALAGIETEGEEADRDDATAVVALTYAGLTGTWPLDTPSDLPSARRGDNGPPSPSRVAVGVPGDLDTICRETLGEGTGPDSPGDYAAQIAPWSRIPLAGSVLRSAPTVRATTAVLPASSGRATVAASGTASPRSGAAGAAGAGVVGAVGAGAAAAVPAGAGVGDAVAMDDDADTNEIPVYRDDQPPSSADTSRVATPADDGGAAPTQAIRPAAGGTAATTGREGPPSSEGATTEGELDDPSARPAARAGATAAAAAATAAGAVGTGAKVIGDRLGRASKTAAELSKERLQEARARREAIREDRSHHSSLGAAPVSADLEAPAPFVPVEAAQTPSREQANLVLMIIAGCVAVACLFGAIGTAQIGSDTELTKILTGDGTVPIEPTTPKKESGSDSDPASGEGGSSGEPFAVLNAAGYDPAPGDGVEHNAEVPRVYDGDPNSVWTTEGYNGPDFGGVKQGVGITVDLGQAQDVTSVTLSLPMSNSATVYGGEQPGTSGSEIGQTNGRTGEVTLNPTDPVKARYVTVWFTSLAQSDDGRYRAALGEISVR